MSGSLPAEFADIHEMAGNRRCRRHRRRDEMRASLETLPALKIAVGGGGAALARRELVGIHGKAHGAARLAPLEARREEDFVQALRFRLLFHKAGPRHDHRFDALGDTAAVEYAGRGAEILDAAIGAG